jgi:Arc/MetJ-type ribon-helix-helix transcriptional regulator
MVIDLEPEQQHVIELAIQSGAFRDSKEVIAAALSILAEDIEDGAVSESRSQETRFTLAEVEAELRALGKLE